MMCPASYVISGQLYIFLAIDLFIYFAHFKTGFSFYCYNLYSRKKCLIRYKIYKAFLHSVNCLFTIFIVSFEVQSFKILVKSNFSSFSLLAFGVIS